MTRPIARLRIRSSRQVLVAMGVASALLLLASLPASAQQFISDNQWVAPHGVATIIPTIGQEYSLFQVVAALLPETEFNLGLTHYWEDPDNRSEAHTTGSFYVKRRLAENAAGTGGWSLVAGTGVEPAYLEKGEVTNTFQTWYSYATYTVPFRDGAVTWDLLPGFIVNLDQDRGGDAAWGMTYASRIAVYEVIPQSALVAEVFGTTGEAYAEPGYRVGVRWESPRLIVTGTYGDTFSGDGIPRFEIGAMIYTDQLKFLCLGKCREDPDW